jgi:hypothetical protein
MAIEKDAIIGATYRDDVFDDEFEIVDIEPDEFDSHEPSDIVLTLEYDSGATIQIDLEQFREDYGIELLDPPSSQQ